MNCVDFPQRCHLSDRVNLLPVTFLLAANKQQVYKKSPLSNNSFKIVFWPVRGQQGNIGQNTKSTFNSGFSIGRVKQLLSLPCHIYEFVMRFVWPKHVNLQDLTIVSNLEKVTVQSVQNAVNFIMMSVS